MPPDRADLIAFISRNISVYARQGLLNRDDIGLAFRGRLSASLRN